MEENSVNMSFETEVLLQRIVVPCLMGLLGALILARCERRPMELGDVPWQRVLSTSFWGSLLFGLGLIVSDFWQRGMITDPASWLKWEAREPWMWMVWLIPGLALFLGIVKILVVTPGRFAGWCLPWVVVGSLAIIHIALPQGRGYEDRLPEAIQAFAIGIAAVSLNSASLNAIASRPGGRWSPCVVLAQLGCIAGLAFQAYASLGEFVLSGAGAALGLALVSLFLSSSRTLDYGWPLAPAVLALVVLAATSLCTLTFYFSAPPPFWLRMSILFLPTIVCGVDLWLGARHWGWRVLAAAILWSLVLSAVVARAMQVKTDW
jgi:hypothetical protein